MPLDMTHVESAMLTATARHKRWLMNFWKGWTQPQKDTMMVRWWDTMPPEVKQAAREQNPKLFAEIEEKIEALKDTED